ncbi:PH domain-containing protein [Streptomyces deserti]
MNSRTQHPQVPSVLEHTPPEPAWQRLHPRMVLVSIGWLAGPALPLVGTMILAAGRLNAHGWIVLGSYMVVAAVQAGHEWFRYRTTRFRITDSKVELQAGLLFRTEKSIPRDRIRSADLTANPVHRLFGLAAVKIGTGEHATRDEDEQLVLDGISREQAVQFRALLLRRADRGAPGEAPALPVPLARMRWSWARYAPLTITTLAGVMMVVTGLTKLLDSFGIDVTELGTARAVWDRLSALPAVVAVAVVVVVLLAIGVAGALVAFGEAWFGYRLEREPGGSLHMTRGLLTSRSVSVEERRIRGAEIVQPLPLRWAGAARVNVLATGLGRRSNHLTHPAQLMPAAPLAAVHGVTADVLKDAASPIASVVLRGHPPAALRRRLVRGCLLVPAAVAATAGGCAAGGLVPWWTLGAAALVLPFGALFARDAYRGLGHALTEDYVVVRQGTFVRRTVALRRDGIIGWRGRQSPFQRRAGLVTLSATVAAGRGVVRIPDMDAVEALRFVSAAVPGLVDPFVERAPADSLPH